MSKHMVRVVAKYVANDSPAGNFRFILVCGINENGCISEGEWMGYTHNNDIHYPFLLQREPTPRLYFGGEEKYYEPTSILDIQIADGAEFTISNKPDENDAWDCKYVISSVHDLL